VWGKPSRKEQHEEKGPKHRGKEDMISAGKTRRKRRRGFQGQRNAGKKKGAAARKEKKWFLKKGVPQMPGKKRKTTEKKWTVLCPVEN